MTYSINCRIKEYFLDGCLSASEEVGKVIVSEILVQLAAYTTSGGQYDQAPRLILQVNICFGHVANEGLRRVRESALAAL